MKTKNEDAVRCFVNKHEVGVINYITAQTNDADFLHIMHHALVTGDIAAEMRPQYHSFDNLIARLRMEAEIIRNDLDGAEEEVILPLIFATFRDVLGARLDDAMPGVLVGAGIIETLVVQAIVNLASEHIVDWYEGAMIVNPYLLAVGGGGGGGGGDGDDGSDIPFPVAGHRERGEEVVTPPDEDVAPRVNGTVGGVVVDYLPADAVDMAGVELHDVGQIF